MRVSEGETHPMRQSQHGYINPSSPLASSPCALCTYDTNPEQTGKAPRVPTAYWPQFKAPMKRPPSRYPDAMEDDHIEQYLALCKRIFERMERDGTWPWEDSQNTQDLLESEHNIQDI